MLNVWIILVFVAILWPLISFIIRKLGVKGDDYLNNKRAQEENKKPVEKTKLSDEYKE